MSADEPTVLIVEDDLGLQSQLKWCLDEFAVCTASDGAEALVQLARCSPAVVLQDLGLPPAPAGVEAGLACMRKILSTAPHTKIIVLTGNEDHRAALEAVAAGAFDYCRKPIDAEDLRNAVTRAFKMAALERENERLRESQAPSVIEGLIASDEGTRAVCRKLEKIAPSDVSVLISGESGTGKELLARALHALSARKQHRFVAINCAAIPENLLESELFGHEKGAFTGAHRQVIGKIELAQGGTLFLDEIGDMALPLQAKLLRFLQSRVIERVGGREELAIDTRIVCATHQDLKGLIGAQRFREDLYYRLSGVVLEVPPLRARGAGITVLAHGLLRQLATRAGRSSMRLSAAAVTAIERHEWPGNVRELENRLNTALILSESAEIGADDLGFPAAAPVPTTLTRAREVAEREAVTRALAMADHNISKASELLGITRPTLYDLMDKLALRPVNE